MTKIPIEELKQDAGKIVDYVREHQEAVTIAGPNGDLVRVVPIPKPKGYWKGRPVYDLDDVQHLDFPYWNEN